MFKVLLLAFEEEMLLAFEEVLLTVESVVEMVLSDRI